MRREISELLKEYDALVRDVRNAQYSQFHANLDQFFAFLENTPEIRNAISATLPTMDFDSWYSEQRLKSGATAGGGRIRWPIDRKQKLSMQLALCRSMATDTFDFPAFGLSFAYSRDGSLSEMTSGVIEQYFSPMARDLRLLLERELAMVPLPDAPASDRIVSLDHNSAPYRAAYKSIGEVIGKLEGVNDYADQDDRQQRLAELKAGQELLKGPRVRSDAIRAVLLTGLIWLADNFAGGIIGDLAQQAIKLLLTLLGF